MKRLGVFGRALAASAASQLIGLVAYDTGRDPAGLPLEVSPLNALMLQVPLYASGLLVPAAAWALLLAATVRIAPAHRAARLAGVLALAGIAWLVEVDLGMQRFRGERLGVNHLLSYGNGNLLNSDWIKPVFGAPLEIAPMVVALIVAVIGVVWALRAAPSETAPQRTAPWALTGLLCVSGAVACYLPTRFAYYHQRQMARSPQAVLVESWLSSGVSWSREAEERARRDLRTQLVLGAGARWLSDSFPVYRAPGVSASPAFGAARQSPPDIVLIMVESLRGRDVGWGFGGRSGADSPTPHLDSLARGAVTWPHYIAAGEPTPRGFVTLHTGVWEHGQLFILANRPELEVDALPLRLRAAGYRNVAIWGGNPSFDNELTWARRWYDELVFDLPDNRLFYFRTVPDRLVMDRAIARVESHDREHPGVPLFAFIAPNGTHTPYDLEEDAAVAPDSPPSTDRQRKYDLTLRNLDAQIGRLIANLKSRSRWENTVIIVVGDHSDRTNEAGDTRWRGMPTDALVATSALIYGPRHLIGVPRADSSTASSVDILPTISAWLGDTAAIATTGRDLFAPLGPNQAAQAVAINSRGYRLDRGGFTLMVDSRDPRVAWAWKSFTGESPALVPLDRTPFAPDEAERLHARIQFWSYLVDRNRVRPPLAR